MQGNDCKTLKVPSRVEVLFLEMIAVLLLVARSRHHSYSIQPRDLYILRERGSIIIITITITTTIHVSPTTTATQGVTNSYSTSTIPRRTTSQFDFQPATAGKYYVMTTRRKLSRGRKTFHI